MLQRDINTFFEQHITMHLLSVPITVLRF